MRPRSFASIAAVVVSLAALAHARDASARDFLVVRDKNGAVAADPPNLILMRNRLLEQYAESGLEVPEVLSVWTTFPMNGSNFGTYIDPLGNDVSGIGLEETFPPTGVHTSSKAPLNAILWHSNALAMDQRAELHHASLDGYGRYLFLLELSHLWGPDIALPAPGPNDAVGFPYHWSFFLDAGAGPAGGNVWTDNGDGTFTVVPGDPATVRYSNLDLYLLGLAEPDEVAPFGVLLPTAVPATPTDPFWGGTYAAHSFPWFDQDAEPLTVTATRRELTIDDVIAANGPRDPGANVKTSWKLGIVLVVPEDATDEDMETAATAFEPLAEQLVPGFADATQDRGSLELVTIIDEPGGGGAGQGGAGPEGGASQGGAPAQGGGGAAADDGADSGDGCSCNDSGGSSHGAFGIAAMFAALATMIRRRRAA